MSSSSATTCRLFSHRGLVRRAATWQTALIVPGMLLVLANCVWMEVVVAVFCLRFRDFQQIVASLIQIAAFVTPVFWNASQLQGKRVVIVHLNPLHHMVGRSPQPLPWARARIGKLRHLPGDRPRGGMLAYRCSPISGTGWPTGTRGARRRVQACPPERRGRFPIFGSHKNLGSRCVRA